MSETETVDEVQEEVVEATFISPNAYSFKTKLLGRKIQFVNGQLTLTDPDDIKEMHRLIAESSAIAKYVQFVDRAAAEEMSKQFQRRVAERGAFTSESINNVARQVLEERDIRLQTARNKNPQLAAELEQVEAAQSLTLTETATETNDAPSEGFIAEHKVATAPTAAEVLDQKPDPNAEQPAGIKLSGK